MTKHRRTVFDRPEIAYIKCVLGDPEFTEEASAILALIKVGDDDHITLGKDNGGIRMIIGDNPVRVVPDEVVDRLKKLAEEFNIAPNEVVHYLNGFPIETGSDVWIESTSEYADEQYPFLRINIGPNATKKQVLNQLDSFDTWMDMAYGSRILKDKGPENYQLVYAVSRARKKGQTFDKIFKLYEDGELPNYKGSRSLGSVEKLKQYFYKYRPKSTI